MPEHESVIQSGQQNLSGATVGGHGVIQQVEQRMYFVYLVHFKSCVVLRLF